MTSKTPADLDTWFVAVSEAVAKLTSRDDLASKRGQDNDEAVVMDGYLATRASHRRVYKKREKEEKKRKEKKRKEPPPRLSRVYIKGLWSA